MEGWERIRGRLLFDNPVSRVGAYSRVRAYSRGALNRSITVYESIDG